METKYAKDAIHVCRLMFGQAVLELLADHQQVTNRALKEKIKVMCCPMQNLNLSTKPRWNYSIILCIECALLLLRPGILTAK